MQALCSYHASVSNSKVMYSLTVGYLLINLVPAQSAQTMAERVSFKPKCVNATRSSNPDAAKNTVQDADTDVVKPSPKM